MWYEAALVTAPASTPITVAQAKDELRIDTSDHDTRLTRYVAAATAFVQAMTGTRCVTQTVDMKCDDWADLSALPLGPVQSITSLTYVDTAGATQTVSTDVYEARLTGLAPHLVLKFQQFWPVAQFGSQITVRAVVGYTAVPDDMQSALLVLVRAMNDDGGVDAVQPTVAALLANYRRF